jgi:hypothetical protein
MTELRTLQQTARTGMLVLCGDFNGLKKGDILEVP